MSTIVVSAAEPSGDLLGAELVRALSSRGDFRFVGVAGPHMRASGVEPLARIEDLSAMGAVEVLGSLSAARRVRGRLCEALEKGPAGLIVVDAPDLHLPVARRARALGVPAIGYVCPQIWAWRPSRVGAITASLNRLLCLLSFEPALFPDLDAHWVGHPVLDRVHPRQEVDEHLYALLPGSREQEWVRHLPVFLEVVQRVRDRNPRARFRVCLPDRARVPPLPAHVERVSRVEELGEVRAALTKSGTITLELAVMGVPQVVAHRVSPVTYQLGRRLVRGVQHISLPNILADREVIPEFVQHLDPDVLCRTLVGLPDRQEVDLSALGGPGGAGRAADLVLECLS